MAKKFNSNSHVPTSILRTTQPSSEFYSIFSKEEILAIIQALETRKEFPLKFSYKGQGAKIWDGFYLKYLVPRWYRTLNVEIDLLRRNFESINSNFPNGKKVDVVDVGAGNSYPVKEFMQKLSKLGKINRYIALDISEDLLKVSRDNFTKWFPQIEFASHTIDIENSNLLKTLSKNQVDFRIEDAAKIILHLGVTMGNHRDRSRVLKNFRDSMKKNDLLVFTNEIGSNSQWDGKARGGFKYHVDQIYAWIKNKIGIRAEDCQLVRKYDLETDSIVANIQFFQDYSINFSFLKIDKSIEISEGEEITIWRQHKYEIPELLQELERAGLQVVHYGTDKYFSNVLMICKVA